ncbi:MAG: murAA [Acidobacteria bacterium]|nr:murAA [Acidobacteriota bacterium]
MSALIVQGRARLGGRVDVGGNKNAALPVLAACLLTGEWCEIDNLPRIRDVDVMLQLLRQLGADVVDEGGPRVRVRCGEVRTSVPDPVLVGRLRGSVLLMGPLLARTGRVVLAPPGGDFPTRRTISTHLQALAALGARTQPSVDGHVLEAPDGLRATSMYLEEASVTGTETALLAAAAAAGVTEIRHAACEPHVAELCRFLRALGAEVEGEGTFTLRVHGGPRLRGAAHRLDGDYIEAGTWAVVGAITHSQVEVAGARAIDLEPIVAVLRRMGVACDVSDGCLSVRPSRLVAVRSITTGLWPGFPSDLVSLVTALATQADGRTLVHDWMYELRLFALEQMSGMNADLFLCDSHRLIVTGPRTLRGKTLDSRDIRSGMALVAAALAAEGESRIEPLETIERGYAHLVDRLAALGAHVHVAH